MDLVEIYCSDSELRKLFHAKRGKPVSALRALKSAAINPQSIPSYLQSNRPVSTVCHCRERLRKVSLT